MKLVLSQGRIDWFINMRWLAILGVGTAILLSQNILKMLPSDVTLYLWMGAGFLLLSNLLFWALKGKVYDSRRFILSQMFSDLFILTYLLHFSGGLENPLFIIYLFHIIIAGILLSRRDTYTVSFVTALLFLLLAFAEYLRFIPHYTIEIFPHPHYGEEVIHASHNLSFVSGISLAFILLVVGTTYFVTTIMEQVRYTSRKLAESEKLMALGQITGYIAHEVNNPIMIISSKAKLALSNKEIQIPQSVREKLKIIAEYSERVANVVRALLNFLSPHQKLEPESIDINKVILESLDLVEPRLRQSQIEVEKNLNYNLPLLKGRFYEMVQVFVNLFQNAVDAISGGGKLSVQTFFNDSRKEIIILVSDSGIGISKEALPRIFEPLYTSKREGKGVGLGLSIVRNIIQSHHGTIEVKSTLGRGTSFRISLPVEGEEKFQLQTRGKEITFLGLAR